ncbi:MAG: hypothetical protein J6J24_05140 [Clostridia bacterium]|nr:hypothetical protein [Clostridia bacterium]
MKKKVLILTVTAGNGHNSAAYAMKKRLETTGEVEVKVVDIIKEYTSALNAWTVDKGYNLAVGYLRPIYDAFYNAYLKWNPEKASVCPAQASVKNLNGKLLMLIYEFEPDVIYGTSYYCGMALSNLKRVYDIPAKVVVCMLDYVVSPFWEASVGGVDFLTLSNEAFREELIAKGFKNENLVLTGIPVSEKFVEVVDKQTACEKLGIDEKLFTVLVFYGGGHWQGGLKVFKTLAKKLKQNVQIIVINGNNKKAKEKIDKMLSKLPQNIKVVNIGFTREVDLYMSASDVMIGKGGGLSTTESINKELPLIATTKLPGQEFYNVKFLEKYGTALTFKNGRQLLKNVEFLYDNPQELKKMKEKLVGMKTNGIETIFELIMKQGNADYSAIDKNIEFDKVNKRVNKARKLASKKRK